MMLINIVLVLNLSSSLNLSSFLTVMRIITHAWGKGERASESAAQERRARTDENVENSSPVPRGKIIHLVIIPEQLFCAFMLPTSSAVCHNRNYNTKSISEKSRLDSL